MKKFFCAILGVAMMAAATTTAFAATIEAAGDSASADVKGKYVNAVREDVYSVDVTWGAMEFDYFEGNQKWNTESHKWEADTESSEGWTVNNNSNTITLANNSSKAVNVDFVFSAKSEYTSLTGTFTYNNAALTSALELELPKENSDAKAYEVTFMPNGEIPKSHGTTAYTKMGTITVTLK